MKRQRGRIIYAKLTKRTPVHYLHIGKTGGTAVKYALNPLKRTKKYEIFLHDHSVKLQDIPCGEKVFFFLRDPIKRYISGFYSRKREGRPRHFTPWSDGERRAFEMFETANQLAEALASSDPRLRSKAEDAMKNIRHVNSHFTDWLGDNEYFYSRLDDILFVGWQESLDIHFDKLKKIICIPDTINLPNDSINSHRMPEKFDKKLSNIAESSLRNWYEKDYQFIERYHKYLNLIDKRI